MQTLYRLTTAALGQYLVLAEDFNSAEKLLIDVLTDQKYGDLSERQVLKSEVLAQNVASSSLKKLSANSDRVDQLLIALPNVKHLEAASASRYLKSVGEFESKPKKPTMAEHQAFIDGYRAALNDFRISNTLVK